MRILYFGSADFGLPTLSALQQTAHTLVGVVTAPDRPRGRSQRPMATAVKDFAKAHQLTVYQPIDLRAQAFQDVLRKVQADVFVVVGFRLLPRVVWSYPPKGSINLHAAWLPHYKGASPIQHAIMEGETHTGLTTFVIQEGVDTGGILLQKKVPIYDTDTGGSLSARLSEKGAQLVKETLSAYAEGHIQPQRQPLYVHTRHAPKLNRTNTQIQWTQAADGLMRLVRALSPTPGAWTRWNGTQYRIFGLEKAAHSPHRSLRPGECVLSKKDLLIGTQTEAVAVTELQAEGKKRMHVTDFLCGYRGPLKGQWDT